MSDQVESAFDVTLRDLEAIKVTYDETTRMATLTMDASTLSNIMTAASLHIYDTPFVPEPVDPEDSLADVVRENNKGDQRWHWKMRDTIDYATGQLNKAFSPQYGDDKKKSIASDRNFRKWRQDSTKEQAQSEEQALQDWFYESNIRDYTGKELDALVGKLKDRNEGVDRPTALRLLATAINAVNKATQAKENVRKAISFLQGRSL